MSESKVTLKQSLFNAIHEIDRNAIGKSGKIKYGGGDPVEYRTLTDIMPEVLRVEEKHGILSTYDVDEHGAFLRVESVTSDCAPIVTRTRQVAKLDRMSDGQSMKGEHTFMMTALYKNLYKITDDEIKAPELPTITKEEADTYKAQLLDTVKEKITELYPKAKDETLKNELNRAVKYILQRLRVPEWTKLDFCSSDYAEALKGLETHIDKVKAEITTQKVKEIENDESPF